MADTKQQKKKYPTIVSPVGVAAYAWIAKPDSGKKYSDDKHKVTLVLDKGTDANEAFVAKINAAHAEARGKKTTESPVKDGNDKDKEEFKGKWLVNFKSKYPPDCVDAVKNTLEGDNKPKSGDKVKVGFAMVPYAEGKNAGVSLQLRAVQLIEKRARQGYGDVFDEEEGGFVSEKTEAPKGSTAEDGDDNPDFS